MYRLCVPTAVRRALSFQRSAVLLLFLEGMTEKENIIPLYYAYSGIFLAETPYA